jgi:TPR repeat protein
MPLLPLILAALLLAGCQTTPPTYRELTEEYSADAGVSAAELREAFLRAQDLGVRLERLGDLEAQALAVVEDEPLKLGSIGSAILDTYVGSLTGHYVLARFYERVSNPKAAFHRDWVERIRASMTEAGDGTRENPYPAVTPVEARIFALSGDLSPVGSIYHTDAGGPVPFSLLLQLQPKEGPLQSKFFDLTGLYGSLRDDFSRAMGAAEPTADSAAGNEDGAADQDGAAGSERSGAATQGAAADFTPFTLVGFLAKQGDTAAQTTVGAFFANQGRFDEATNWLRAASRTGNLFANSLLARIYWERSRNADSDAERQAALDEVMENYLHAIALGSAEAMYALGVLYLNGHYGDENKISGVPLLEQAAGLEQSEAAMFLAHLHYAGEVVDEDPDAARRYYARAAAQGNEFARKSYARFLLDRQIDQPGDPRALDWLEELAEEGEAESMLLLGNLHARGIGTERSPRRAVRWYKQAVAQAPGDPNIVNEVAWTLAVSEQQDLRRARYARDIMDRLMETSEEARQRPEYLDTWAATYAATGDFERAVALQQRAVDAAADAEYEDVMQILRDHLEAFSAGETISEAVP